MLFDVAFVLVCVAAALAVRPRDFFVIGVLPPLLMAGTVAVLALLDLRGTSRTRATGSCRRSCPGSRTTRARWSSATR